jgi:GDSL-like Lipase/Acylhydrolase family
LSIGGNDAGFGDIVESCVRPDRSSCDRDPERWLDPLPGVEASLSAAYAEIERAAPNAQLFVLTYPQPLGPRHCSASLLDRDEFDFLARQFIPALNRTIRRAAAEQEIPVIDLSNSFRGLRLCEVIPRKSALNRVEFPRLHNSFHPNEIGHALMSSAVVRELRLAGYSIAPVTDELPITVPVTPATDEPADTDEPVAPSPTPAPSPGTLPPTPDDTAPAATIIEDGAPADCQALPTSPIRLDPSTTSIRISEAAPNTEICYRIDGGDWNVTTADGNGVADIPIDDQGRPLAVDTVFVDRTDSSVTLSFLLSE